MCGTVRRVHIVRHKLRLLDWNIVWTLELTEMNRGRVSVPSTHFIPNQPTDPRSPAEFKECLS